LPQLRKEKKVSSSRAPARPTAGAEGPGSNDSAPGRATASGAAPAGAPGAHAASGRSRQLFGLRATARFGWRIALAQFLENAVVIGLLIVLLPGFELHASHEVLAVLWLAAVFGVVSSLVRPTLEFLFLPYVLQTLGLVMVAINAVLLALLGLTRTLEIRGVLALLVGAVVAGVVGFVLDGVLGLTPPVVDDASAGPARRARAIGLAAVSERLRAMQLYGVVLQYAVDFAFDWRWLRPFRRRMQGWLWRLPVPRAPLEPQVKARLLLQDLGPTYVKLGQIISSQGRALPREWEKELAKLQSDVPPFAYDDVKAIIAKSLGAPPEELYTSFNPRPLAAASLAQVHEATTHDGVRVAVKVQRPNIHEQLRSDITIMARAAAVLERRVEWAADNGVSSVVREFGSTLLRELDYAIEAYNTRRLERVLAPIDGVHVPGIDPSLSSDRVLTLEFVEGVKSTDTTEIDAAGLDRGELARVFVRGAVQMVMIHGFFHADPHPGNIVVDLVNGRLTFLDCGMVGELDLRQRITFGRFLLAFRDGDVSGVATTLRALSKPFREPNPDYQRQFERRIGPLMATSAEDTSSLEKLAFAAMDVLRDAGYRLDPELTLGIKAIAQAEEITAALAPEAGAADFAELGGAALEELVPRAVTRDRVAGVARKQAARAAGGVVDSLPAAREAGARWLQQLRKGEIPVSVRVSDVERPAVRLEALLRVVAVSIVVAGVVIGSAIAASVDTGKSVFRADLSDVALVLYLCGTAVAALLIVVLVWRLIHPGRHVAKE
jgi:ubiquinone biosynthesis protein